VGRRAAGVPAVAAHGMCPAAPGCAWVHLLRASFSALPALLCRSAGQRPTHSLKGSVPEAPAHVSERKAADGGGGSVFPDGGGGSVKPHAFTAASTDRGTRTPRVGTGEQTARSARVTEHNNWISLVRFLGQSLCLTGNRGSEQSVLV